MIITLENFTKSYGEKQLFAGVNLSMDAGDKVGIVGVNGPCPAGTSRPNRTRPGAPWEAPVPAASGS